MAKQESRTGQVVPVPFPGTARLKKPTDFKRVFKQNAASTDGLFRVIARPSGLAKSRLGLAVSRKIDRRAVGRNRIKRVVRESFRLWRAAHAFDDGQAMDIVVLARPGAADADNERLFSSLNHHWPVLSRRVRQRFQGTLRPGGSKNDG